MNRTSWNGTSRVTCAGARQYSSPDHMLQPPRLVHMMAPGDRHGSYGRGSDNGPLSRLRLLQGCVVDVCALLQPGDDLQRLLQLLLVGIWPSGGQLPADGDGFLDRGQRLLPPPQVGQPDRQVVQRAGQVGPERVRAGRGQLPADGDGLLDRGQRLLPPPQVAQPDRQVVQRAGQTTGGVRLSAGHVGSVLGDLLAGEDGGKCSARLARSASSAGAAVTVSWTIRGSAVASSSLRAARRAGWFGAPRVNSASSWVRSAASCCWPAASWAAA